MVYVQQTSRSASSQDGRSPSRPSAATLLVLSFVSETRVLAMAPAEEEGVRDAAQAPAEEDGVRDAAPAAEAETRDEEGVGDAETPTEGKGVYDPDKQGTYEGKLGTRREEPASAIDGGYESDDSVASREWVSDIPRKKRLTWSRQERDI